MLEVGFVYLVQHTVALRKTRWFYITELEPWLTVRERFSRSDLVRP